MCIGVGGALDRWLEGGRWLTKRHQGQVCHGAVPHRHLDHIRRRVRVAGGYVDLLGLAGDLLYGAHEQIRHYGDSKKTGEK